MKLKAREAAEDLDIDTPPVRRADVGTAMTDGSSIYYAPEFADDLERNVGSEALQFVAAHEMGHMLSDARPGPANELSADRLAGRSLSRSGAEIEAIMELFGHMAPESPDGPHPSRAVRERQARRAYRDESDR